MAAGLGSNLALFQNLSAHHEILTLAGLLSSPSPSSATTTASLDVSALEMGNRSSKVKHHTNNHGSRPSTGNSSQSQIRYRPLRQGQKIDPREQQPPSRRELLVFLRCTSCSGTCGNNKDAAEFNHDRLRSKVYRDSSFPKTVSAWELYLDICDDGSPTAFITNKAMKEIRKFDGPAREKKEAFSLDELVRTLKERLPRKQGEKEAKVEVGYF